MSNSLNFSFSNKNGWEPSEIDGSDVIFYFPASTIAGGGNQTLPTTGGGGSSTTGGGSTTPSWWYVPPLYNAVDIDFIIGNNDNTDVINFGEQDTTGAIHPTGFWGPVVRVV